VDHADLHLQGFAAASTAVLQPASPPWRVAAARLGGLDPALLATVDGDDDGQDQGDGHARGTTAG
jgi:hypothetical protein